jgi:hypothetical protein
MKKGLTEAVCILDMTGSMASRTSDTIGSFNKFVAEQKEIPGECKLSVIFFNDAEYKKWQDAVDLARMPELTNTDYRPNNNTPLYDAIGRTINEMGKRLADMAEKNRPERMLVMIMTDGMENASKEFTFPQIAEMIKHQREKYSWEFIFLGADLDSFGQGAQMGIAHTKNYNGSISCAYQCMSNNLRSYRSEGKVEN